jgi:membrane associated rhomboid family serine protease
LIPLHDDNPTQITPYLTIGLIVACALVFFWQLSLGEAEERMIYALGMIPAVLFDIRQLPPEISVVPPVATLFTSMFLHGGWMHLIGNMLFLWVFGDNVEHAMGRLRFLIFYLACGAAGGAAHYLSVPDSTAPLIGASAAIAGIVAAYLMLFPNVKVWILLLLRIPLKLSAKWVLGAWILFQFVNLFASTDPQTAWWAHIGGLIAGAVLVVFLRRPDVPLFATDVRVIADVR